MQDIPSATVALNSLQGTILYSSPAGEGMRLEYPLVTIIASFFVGFYFIYFFGVAFLYFMLYNICLTRILDMLNRGWVCGGSRSKLCAGNYKKKKRSKSKTLEKSSMTFLRDTLAIRMHYEFYLRLQ